MPHVFDAAPATDVATVTLSRRPLPETSATPGDSGTVPRRLGGGCAFNGCSEIRRGDGGASAVVYELGEPHGTWQPELHELFTRLRNPNVHGGLSSATPVPHPAGPNLHPVHAVPCREPCSSLLPFEGEQHGVRAGVGEVVASLHAHATDAGCRVRRALAHRDSGMTSVGLKAVALVKER
jgi:hypothetical protein